MHEEPNCYDTNPEVKHDLKTYRLWAEEAWLYSCNEMGQSDMYYRGFVDGFVDYVFAGGAGNPPVVPPCFFWRQSAKPLDSDLDEWNNGFRHGAHVAMEGGYRDQVVVPVCGASPNAGRQNFSGRCTPSPKASPTAAEQWDSGDALPLSPIQENAQQIRPEAKTHNTAEDSLQWADTSTSAEDIREDETLVDEERWHTESENGLAPHSNEDVAPDLESGNLQIGNPGSPPTPSSEKELPPLQDNDTQDESFRPQQPEPTLEDIDLDDLFSRDSQNSTDVHRASFQSPEVSSNKGTSRSGEYDHWSYGDIVKASQSSETIAIPAGDNMSRHESLVNESTILRTSNHNKQSFSTIRFAPDSPTEDPDGGASPLGNSSDYLGDKLEDQSSTIRWRISDWRRRFKTDDFDSANEGRATLDAWNERYGGSQ